MMQLFSLIRFDMEELKTDLRAFLQSELYFKSMVFDCQRIVVVIRMKI